MLEGPEDFKEGNKINLITFSSTKYHTTKFNKISGFMLKNLNRNYGKKSRACILNTIHCNVKMLLNAALTFFYPAKHF